MNDLGIIVLALSRLPVPADRRAAFEASIGDYIDRLAFAGIAAGIRPAPAGTRGSPVEIDKAVGQIARGLEMIERGMSTIDGAQRSTSRTATKRTAELSRLQRATLAAIVGAATRRLPMDEISDSAIDAAMPTYGTHGFGQSWNGVFKSASVEIEAVKASISRTDLKAPRPRDDWFIGLVAILAGVYADATGKPARAYASGQAVDEKWGAPFCRFVTALWPAYAGEAEQLPSESKIRDALRDARIDRITDQN